MRHGLGVNGWLRCDRGGLSVTGWFKCDQVVEVKSDKPSIIIIIIGG